MGIKNLVMIFGPILLILGKKVELISIFFLGIKNSFKKILLVECCLSYEFLFELLRVVE